MATFNNGQLIQVTGTAPIYQIILGEACWVPDQTTFGNLYGSYDTVQQISQADLDSIPRGPKITSGASLGSGPGGTVYLLSWGLANPITGPGFATYQFNGPIQSISQSALDGMLMGWALT